MFVIGYILGGFVEVYFLLDFDVFGGFELFYIVQLIGFVEVCNQVGFNQASGIGVYLYGMLGGMEGQFLFYFVRCVFRID